MSSQEKLNVPTIEMNNGLKIPGFGLGTWQARTGEVQVIVEQAIDVGYRHFDCAMVYQNEKEIGTALNKKIKDGSVQRDELFVVSKLWNTYHKPEIVVEGCKKTLSNFGLDYLDLYLIHWPFAFQPHDEFFPRDANGQLLTADYDYVDTWREMEKCVELGLVKSIGISNFNSHQITRVLDTCKIRPAVHQIECHPYLNQRKLIEFCKNKGIVVTAYSPLGSPSRPWARPDEPVLLDDPKLLAISKKLNKTPGQVVLRYLVQLGVIPIPKTTNSQRLKDNVNIFNFELNEDDVREIDSFDCNGRLCLFRDARDHKDYPFNIEF